MSITLSPVQTSAVWFTPESFADDGVRVLLRPLTASEHQRIQGQAIQQKLTSPESDSNELAAGIVRDAFELCISDTDGIQIDSPSGGTEKPSSGGELHDALASSKATFSALMNEIYTAIIAGSVLQGEALGK